MLSFEEYKTIIKHHLDFQQLMLYSSNDKNVEELRKKYYSHLPFNDEEWEEKRLKIEYEFAIK